MNYDIQTVIEIRYKYSLNRYENVISVHYLHSFFFKAGYLQEYMVLNVQPHCHIPHFYF